MNVILLMSGGVGSRFGANIPKQYVNLNGKPVIDYVLEASLRSKLADKIVVVMDEKYKNISKLLASDKIAITNNGKNRYASLKNGLEYIKNNYKCDNVLIVDAVAPFIYPELIDNYFSKLDEFDIILTGQKITGALCDFEGNPYDRENYFMSQAPEAFKFDMLYENVDYDTKFQAISSLMPKDAKKFVNFNFKNNLKLTYDFELKYAEFLLNYQEERNMQNFDNISSGESFETKGLRKYLLRSKKKKTTEWLNNIYLFYKELKNKYGNFNEFTLNQSSNYGLVILISTNGNYEFVLKLIPDFLNRYKTEKAAYQIFDPSWMCKLLEYDDNNGALYLEKLETINSKIFDNNMKLTAFFDKVFSTSIEYDQESHQLFEKIIDNLNTKLKKINKLPLFQEKFKEKLEKAIQYYNQFSDAPLKLIHGDLRIENIMQFNDEYKAIDPIGYIAPLEMEPARFIISDVFHNKGYDCIYRINILLNFFKKWFNYDKLIYGLYIYYVMIAYNSVFENEDDVITLYYLNIIDRLETDLISNL